jgi:type IV secretory pathway TrbD component
MAFRSLGNATVQTNLVFRFLNRPLTILEAERKLFFVALVMSACVFNLFSSLMGALGMFFALYWCARWATRTDPQILRFLLNSAKIRTQYDPMKFEPVAVRRLPRV